MNQEYIPALKYDWLTSLYDPLVRATLREDEIKGALIAQARIVREHRVLDLGCGTATLTTMVKQRHPDASVTGLDGDPKALQFARAKALRAGVEIAFDQAMCFALPYGDGAFDRVLSSLMFHHLTLECKERTLSEIHRVLSPGGELHVADWGKPQNWLTWTAFNVVRWFDSWETTEENAKGLLPDLFLAAGFEGVEQTRQYATVFGTLALYRASKVEMTTDARRARRHQRGS